MMMMMMMMTMMMMMMMMSDVPASLHARQTNLPQQCGDEMPTLACVKKNQKSTRT